MSFRLKTILGVALIEGCLLLLLVWSSVSYLQDASQNEVSIRAQSSSRLFADLVRDAVLSSDIARLDSLARQALDAPDMSYIRIMDNERVLVSAGDASALSRPFEQDASLGDVNDHVFDVGSDIVFNGQRYGRVELGITTDRATGLIADARRYLFSLAAIEMVLVALFSYALGTYLTRGLGSLTRAANNIGQGRPHVPIHIKGNDELAITGRAFNTMGSWLAESQQSMQQQMQESHRLTQRLAEKEQRLSTILNAAFSGIITLNEHGIIEEINTAGATLFGYQPKQLTGRPLSCLLPEVAPQPDFSPGTEMQGRHQQGRDFAVEMSCSKLQLSGKKMRLCLVRDLSEHKRIEQESRRHAAISTALVAANMDAVVIIDLDDNIVEFSAMAERLFGYSREQALGQKMAELLIPYQMRTHHHQGMRHYRQTGQGPILGKHIEVDAVRASGEQFPAELTVQTIQLDGTVLFAGFMRDISSRKAAEQQLQEARLKAEAASNAKSRFLAHMSHEIRSPLNAVLGSVGLLLEDDLNREQRIYAQTAQASGKGLLGLINNILDFSKIEAGQLELDPQSFLLNELLSDVADHIALRVREQHLQTLLVAAPHTPQALVGDVTRLRQVLLNLLDNALKFTEQGAVTLQVYPLKAQGDEVRLCFSVQDSGIGIPLAAQASLFEEFQQVDSSDSTRHGGTGLGLSISRGLCETMGGSLTLHSKPGTGARFDATLPFAVTEPTQAVANAQRPPWRLWCHGLHPLAQDAIALALGEYADALFTFNPDAVLPEDDRQHVLLVNSQLPSDQQQALTVRARNLGIDKIVLLSANEVGGSLEQVRQCDFDALLMMPLLAEPLRNELSGTPPPTSTPSKPANAPAVTEDAPSRGHILLAEDSPANQLVAKAMLTRAGYRVDVAENGLQAVAACAREQYDLILMDLRMPQMNGLEATAIIRAQQGEVHLPILAMTANVSQQDIDRCLAAGMDDFIAKPIDTRHLLAALQRHLNAEAAPASAPVASEQQAMPKPDIAPLLDEQVMLALINTITLAKLPRLTRLFISEVDQRLTHFQEAIAQQALEKATLEAHTIKGCAGTFGATRLHYWARDMEAACRNADHSQINALTTQMATLYQQTIRCYQNKIIELTGEQDETDPMERDAIARRTNPAG